MPLGVAVVGLGFGATFAHILRDHPECELHCVADLNEEMRTRTARDLNVRHAARTLDEVLALPEVQAVALFTHAPRHAEHAIAALQAGKHVLCAVPAAVTLDECARLVAAVEETGLVYANAETSYWRPPTAQCRRWFREGRFGRIVYMEAQYLHDRVEGARTTSPSEYGGKDWRAAGFPPFLYITHSTGHILGVTGGRLVEVTAYPSPVPDDDTYRADTYWHTPFGNAVALFRTDDGIPARIMEMRRVAFPSTETFSIYGENLSFVSPPPSGWERGYPVYRRDADGAIAAAAPWHRQGIYAPLPDPLVKHTFGGHEGSHPYIVADWVEAILRGGAPAVDVYEAVAFCAPGIVAHQSCLKEGERLKIPQFGRRDKEKEAR